MKTLFIAFIAFIRVATAQDGIIAEYKFETFMNHETFGNVVKVFVHNNGLIEITKADANSVFAAGNKPNFNQVILEMPQEKLYTSLPSELAGLSSVKTEKIHHSSICKMMVMDRDIKALKLNINGVMTTVSTSGDCWEYVTVQAVEKMDAARIQRVKEDLENIVLRKLSK